MNRELMLRSFVCYCMFHISDFAGFKVVRNTDLDIFVLNLLSLFFFFHVVNKPLAYTYIITYAYDHVGLKQ